MPIHHSHPDHELILTHHKNTYKCDGCKMDGNGECYRCSQCNYDLHKGCMHPEETLTLEAFPNDYIFKFLDHPPPPIQGRACDVCGMDVQGFVYHCTEKGVDAHPQCAMLKREIHAEGDVFELRSDVLPKCNYCKRKKLKGTVENVRGFSYVSRCGENSLSFHVYCMMGMWNEHRLASAAEIPDRRLQRSGEMKRVNSLFLQKPITGLVKGGGSKVVKVVKLFLKIVLSVLIGDPTTFLASFAIDLLTS